MAIFEKMLIFWKKLKILIKNDEFQKKDLDENIVHISH